MSPAGPRSKSWCPGELLESSIVGIDRVAAECSGESSLVFGRKPVLDSRLRCPLCHVGAMD